VEQKFAMLYGCIRAMLNEAHFVNKYKYLQHGLWAECTATATKLKNIIVKGNTAPSYNAFFNKEVPYKESLWTFREVAIVHNAKTLCSKLEKCSVLCLFIGYVDNHPCDMFHMFNMQTKKVWCTRDTKCIATNIATYDQISMNTNMSKMQTYHEYDDDYDYDGCNNPQNINDKKDNNMNNNDYNNHDANDTDANDNDDQHDDDKTATDNENGTSMTIAPPTSCTLHEMQHLAT